MTTVLTFVAEKVVLLLDSHDLTTGMDSSGKNIRLRYQPTPDGKPHVMSYRIISFGTVFLLALIMAVPNVKPRLRLKILGIGYAVIFGVQVVHLVVYVFNYYGQHMNTVAGQSLYPVFWRKALFYTNLTMLRLSAQAVPVLIWAGLYFYFVWYDRYFKKAKPAPDRTSNKRR
ncbi:MAG: hypothetical protein OEV49_15155 [candidate division Zixibacteria bacterium]|nr:hypothetical protein [candidate division Zixibacteria bacterium]MDH3936052.1 hypothetical protein [candidate division Zixibacteria bacterium]MDH4034379.1 hypothetical protein [candidate division Zixibacteria bacterium]